MGVTQSLDISTASMICLTVVDGTFSSEAVGSHSHSLIGIPGDDFSGSVPVGGYSF